jgi:hypothetical protein
MHGSCQFHLCGSCIFVGEKHGKAQTTACDVHIVRHTEGLTLTPKDRAPTVPGRHSLHLWEHDVYKG